MDSQDTNSISYSQQTSKDAPSTEFLNQFAPLNLAFQPNYQFQPMPHQPMPASNQYGTPLSYQDLLSNSNIPIDISQFCTTTKSQRGKSTGAQKSNNSQTTIANKNWNSQEDVALTKAWLSVSVDADVGNSQKNSTMWNRILQAWKDHMGTSFNTFRNINSLVCRWQKIQSAVNKFHGIYESLERHPQSGTNLEKLKREAMHMYENANKNKPFKYEHCWEIMKTNPKWCSQQLTKTNGSSKPKTPAIATDGPANNLGDDSNMDAIGYEDITADGVVRPQGRKACKEKKRKVNDEKGVVDALNKLQCTLEMQIKVDQEELEMKKEREKREFELREQILKKEIELKEEAQRMKMKDQRMKEEAQILKKKDQELTEKAQRRQDQDRIMNQDLTKLSPALRETYETYRAQILKEWENEGLFGSNI